MGNPLVKFILVPVTIDPLATIVPPTGFLTGRNRDYAATVIEGGLSGGLRRKMAKPVKIQPQPAAGGSVWARMRSATHENIAVGCVDCARKNRQQQ